VIESVESAVTLYRDLEAASGARVLHGDSHSVFLGMPQELNVDSVALARGELTTGGRFGGYPFRRVHSSSLISRLGLFNA
jgi:hypothetical protein